MGKELDTDFAPLDLDTQPGFQPDLATMQQLVKLAFHFWTRGFPERVRFGSHVNARLLHGAHATLLYYQEGFRSGYFQIQPGEHVNDAPIAQTNPFPTLFVLTSGKVTSRIGDTTCELVGGEAVYIGPGVRHEFWVDDDAEEGGEGLIMMFGEGA
jgi:quercetin dioxygenase-like cupin family protein